VGNKHRIEQEPPPVFRLPELLGPPHAPVAAVVSLTLPSFPPSSSPLWWFYLWTPNHTNHMVLLRVNHLANLSLTHSQDVLPYDSESRKSCGAIESESLSKITEGGNYIVRKRSPS
jgi:hypothetical protein